MFRLRLARDYLKHMARCILIKPVKKSGSIQADKKRDYILFYETLFIAEVCGDFYSDLFKSFGI